MFKSKNIILYKNNLLLKLIVIRINLYLYFIIKIINLINIYSRKRKFRIINKMLTLIKPKIKSKIFKKKMIFYNKEIY